MSSNRPLSPDRVPSRPRVAALAAVLLVSCGAPLPSREPLGVGPLPPDYHLAGAKKPPHEDRRALASSGRRTGAGESEPRNDAPTPAEPTTPKATVAAPPVAGSAPMAAAALDGAAFVGDYRGDDVSTYHLSGMPERTEKDPNARVTVTSSDKTKIDLVLVDSSNGKDICTLNAVVADGRATVTPGQKCFEQSGSDATATASIKTGTATLDGRKLVLDLALDFEMHVPEQDVTGTLDYHFEGTRR